MFQGYNNETFEFFMAIAFNNNVDFFHANHDWYLRGVREPSLHLAEALSPVIEEIDDTLDRRPNRVVSRINRDIRFSKDKSPYRDYLWLSFHRPRGEENSPAELFFDLSASGARVGMGFYSENRGMMNALRQRIRTEPDALAALFESVSGEFNLHVNAYKRIAIPDIVPDSLRGVYPAKDFFFEKPIRDFELIQSPALPDELAAAFRRLAPLYRLLAALVPIEEP